MNKYLVSSISALAIFLGACSDGQTVTNDFQDAKPTAKISFMVRDGVTGTGLDSVSILKLDQDSNSTMSNVDGFASFSKVKIGQYYFQVSRPGYATVVVTQVVLDIGNSDAPRVPDLNVNLLLPKAGATVSGRAFYTDINGGTKAAANAKVELTLGDVDGFVWPQPILSATTDESGYYVFENLPAGVTYSIDVRQLVVDDISYSSTHAVTVAGVGVGESKSAPFVDMTASGGIMRVMTTNFWGDSNLGASDSLYLEFTESANVDQVEPGDIRVRATIDGLTKDLLVGTIWKNENKTLIIYPIDGKWWADVPHNLSLSLSSVEGVSLTGFTGSSATFEVSAAVGEVGQASALEFSTGDTTVPDYNESYFELTWSPAKNAEGYALWVKTGSDSTYMLRAEYDDTVATFNSAGYFDDGKAVSFRVVAFNSKYMADPAKAPSLTIKDGIKPMTITNTIGELDLSAYTLNNTGSVADTLTLMAQRLNITFTEVMDTTIVPKITVASAMASKVSVIWIWDTNARGAKIYTVIKAGQDANTIEGLQLVSIDVASLKDLAGNSINLTSNDETKYNMIFQ